MVVAEQVQMLGVQLRVRDIEVASLKANENQLHSAAGALKAEVGFKEGQQVQLVENAQATLKSAQEAVLQKVRERVRLQGKRNPLLVNDSDVHEITRLYRALPKSQKLQQFVFEVIHSLFSWRRFRWWTCKANRSALMQG